MMGCRSKQEQLIINILIKKRRYRCLSRHSVGTTCNKIIVLQL